MASPPISEPRFLDFDGVPCEPIEWRPCLLELPCPADAWEAARLLVNGDGRETQLRRIGGRARVVAPWPESPAGRYRIRWQHAGTWGETVVFVPPSKISTQGLRQLLAASA